MSNDKKYNKKTIMTLLRLMLSVRSDLSKEEKESIVRLAEEMMNKGTNKDYEDKQIFPIEDYKRRN